MPKLTRTQAQKRLDEARDKVLLVMRNYSNLSAKESTDLFKLSNDILRLSTRIYRQK